VPIILSGGCPDLRLAATTLPSSPKIRMAQPPAHGKPRPGASQALLVGGRRGIARHPASIARMMTRASG